ncbi:hypothetical protein I546_3818 [Mycobacterium kansasii 732]|nr:hypothetical protein I546_3818 [Mycobacterium kansasii 732]
MGNRRRIASWDLILLARSRLLVRQLQHPETVPGEFRGRLWLTARR